MTRLGVDVGALDNFLDELAGCERQLAAARESVDDAVRQAHARWLGSAAAAHAQAQRDWAAGESEMRAALAQLREVAATVAANYGAVVGANLRMWAR